MNACILCASVLIGVQVYQAERPDWPVRVYNLLYEDSQEADKFSAAVAREVRFTCCCAHIPSSMAAKSVGLDRCCVE